MKKIVALLFVFVCLLMLVACNTTHNDNGDNSSSNSTALSYFVGKVVQIEESGCRLEVIDVGNCDKIFQLGAAVDIKTTIENCPDYALGDVLRVEFEGIVTEVSPHYIMYVTAIYKTDLPK